MTISQDQYEIEKKIEFLRGLSAGIYEYAWWKDGTMYVGTSGKTYKEAITPITEQLDELKTELKKLSNL